MSFGIAPGDGGCLSQHTRIRSKFEKSYSPLPEQDPVQQSITGDSAQELRDEVISSGSLSFQALQVNRHEDLWRVGQDLTVQLTDDGLTKIAYSQGHFTPEAVTRTASLIATEVNDYTNSGGADTKRIKSTLSDILKPLELDANTGEVFTTRAEVSDEGESRHLTTTLFYNNDTHKTIAVLTSEGHM